MACCTYSLNNADEIKLKKKWEIDENKKISTIKIVPENSKSVNYAFDVTPSKYISKLITEKGVIDANEKSIKGLKEI